MAFLVFLVALAALTPLLDAQSTQSSQKVVCAYDHKAYYRQDSGKFATADLENALSQCTHVLYGYAKLDGEEFKIRSTDTSLDTDSGKQNYIAVTGMKKRFPGLRVLLSIGGWADDEEDKSDKYLALLRNPTSRGDFVNSVRTFVTKYGFDGIDLAWQFPFMRVKERGTFGSFFHKIKKTTGFAKGSKDPQAEEHKAGFTALIKQMKLALRPDGLLVTATVIPHTNYSTYWDVREIHQYLDAINIQAFDYLIPDDKISPEQADFPAPLMPTFDRNPNFNIDTQVKWFLSNGAPPGKLVLGIPTYGRTWKLTDESAKSGVPPLVADHEGAEGHLTKKRGILSFAEICTMLQNQSNRGTKGLLRKVTDPSDRLGTYAYRQEDNDREGIWVGYEDQATVNTKAAYARKLNLGGIALYDVTMDDSRGICTGDRFPLLRAARTAFI